jgi:hypothetical protein
MGQGTGKRGVAGVGHSSPLPNPLKGRGSRNLFRLRYIVLIRRLNQRLGFDEDVFDLGVLVSDLLFQVIDCR